MTTTGLASVIVGLYKAIVTATRFAYSIRWDELASSHASTIIARVNASSPIHFCLARTRIRPRQIRSKLRHKTNKHNSVLASILTAKGLAWIQPVSASQQDWYYRTLQRLSPLIQPHREILRS